MANKKSFKVHPYYFMGNEARALLKKYGKAKSQFVPAFAKKNGVSLEVAERAYAVCKERAKFKD